MPTPRAAAPPLTPSPLISTEVDTQHHFTTHLTTFPRIAQIIAERGEFSFSTAYGLNGSATETHRPYASDKAAKQDRDDLAKVLRRAGHRVRCSTLPSQFREWWGWQVPCGITCTVYRVEIVERADAVRAGHCLPPETLAFAAALLGAGTTITA